jgi:hypothetical protein
MRRGPTPGALRAARDALRACRRAPARQPQFSSRCAGAPPPALYALRATPFGLAAALPRGSLSSLRGHGPDPDRMELALPLLDQLGEGGMGVVYRAEDVRLGREVAIKLLRTREVPSAEWLARFEREARLASSLQHPHICTIHELGEHEGQPFIVMERLEGRTVRQLIDGPIRPSGCSRWPGRPPMRSTRRTAAGSSTATSSRPTCSSPTATTSRCSTSAWPSSRGRRGAQRHDGADRAPTLPQGST